LISCEIAFEGGPGRVRPGRGAGTGCEGAGRTCDGPRGRNEAGALGASTFMGRRIGLPLRETGISK
jgi:hypothetical protein